MSQAELACLAIFPPTLVADFEASAVTPRPADVAALRWALERAGVEFIDGDRPGVRCKNRPR